MTNTLFPVADTPARQTLADATTAIAHAPSTTAALRVAAEALQGWGFGRVMLVARDANMAPLEMAMAGSDHPESSPDAMQALPGVIWRQRLPLLARYATEHWFLLPGADPWVAREFWACTPTAVPTDGEWGEQDLVVALLSGPGGQTMGTAVLADSDPVRRPDQHRGLEVYALLRQLGGQLAFAAAQGRAEARGTRLQRLQESGAALARPLDEGEIVVELARHAARATGAEGAVVVVPDLVSDSYRPLARIAAGTPRPVGGSRTLGDGVFAEVARSGRPVRFGASDTLAPVESGADWSPLAALDVMGDVVSQFGPPASVLAVPVMSGIQLHGVVAVHASASNRFSAEDENVLVTMASQAATALANARRYAESEHERRQTEALADVARAVGESLRPGEVLQLILRHAIALLKAEGAYIALRQKDWLHIVAGTGAASLFAGVHVPLDGSLVGRVTECGEPLFSNNVADEPRAYAPLQRLAAIRNAVVAPLSTARGMIGAVAVINRESPFAERDVRVLTRLANQVAVAIVNARLFDEVQRATQQWKVAFDAVATGLAVLDDARRITRCNTRLVELCERSSVSELLGSPFMQLLLGDATLSADDDVIAQALRTGTVVRGEIRHARRGAVYAITAAPHPDGGTMVTVDDIGDGRRIADRFQRVVETALDAIVITDEDRRISFANPAARELLGRDESLVGMLSSELIAPESAAAVARHESLALAGDAQRYECELLHADGSRRHVDVSSAPLVEVGALTGTVACLRDISAARSCEGALARAESRYQRFVEEAEVGIFTLDLAGCFTSVNEAFEKGSGDPREAVLGKRYATVLDRRDHDLADETVRRTLSGETLEVELRYPSVAGGARCVTLLLSPLRAGNRIVGALGVVRGVPAAVPVTAPAVASAAGHGVDRPAS